MKLFLLSDNVDTQRGMRLAGVDGVVVHERDEVAKAFSEALLDKSIGVLLVAQKLVKDFPDLFMSAKMDKNTPLVVEIPDRHGQSGVTSIADYVREAVGISI